MLRQYLERAPRVRRQFTRTIRHQLDGAIHVRERRAQLMRDERNKIRLEGGELAKHDLGALSLGDVFDNSEPEPGRAVRGLDHRARDLAADCLAGLRDVSLLQLVRRHFARVHCPEKAQVFRHLFRIADVRHVHLHQLCLAVSQHPTQRGIDAHEPQIGRRDAHADGAILEDAAKPFLAGKQFILHPPALRNVLDHRDASGRTVRVDLDQRRCEIGPQRFAALRDVPFFEAIRLAVAREQVRHGVQRKSQIVAMSNVAHGQRQQLLLGVPQHLAECAVHLLEPQVGVGDDDRDRALLEDLPEALLARP